MHLKAVVFDWAGTTVDYGSRAPMGAFVEVFKGFQVKLSIDEARKPMGLPKWDHIKALLSDQDIARRWQKAHGAMPTDREVGRIYEVFVPLNRKVVTNYAELIPGVAETVKDLRGLGLKIGSTTGYTRDIMEPLLPVAAKAGYAPDNLVCAGDLAAGRPTPLMMWKCFLDLAIPSAAGVIKVDDTAPGIAEGLAAGCWTVGLTVSGNAMGLSEEDVGKLSKKEFAARKAKAERELLACGSHYVIDSVAELMPVVWQIEARLVRGERP